MLVRAIAAAGGALVLALAGVGAALALHEGSTAQEDMITICASPGGPLKLAQQGSCAAAGQSRPVMLTIIGSSFGAGLADRLNTVEQTLTIHGEQLEQLAARIAALEEAAQRP